MHLSFGHGAHGASYHAGRFLGILAFRCVGTFFFGNIPDEFFDFLDVCFARIDFRSEVAFPFSCFSAILI